MKPFRAQRQWVPLGAMLLSAAFVACLWGVSTGDVTNYLLGNQDLPPGQRAYVLSKLFGLLGIVWLWLQALFATARFVPGLRFLPAPARDTHRLLGMGTVVVILAHIALYVSAVTLRGDKLASGVLVPSFSGSYFEQQVAWGILAAGLLLLVAAAGALRARMRVAAWLHRAWIAAFALGFLHSISLGTETRMGPMPVLYVLMGASLSVGATCWLWAWLRDRMEALRYRHWRDQATPDQPGET